MRKFFLILLILTGCEESVLHDLTELEVNKMVTHLHVAGINASKEKQPDGRWSLTVSNSDVPTAMQEIEKNRLAPRRGTEKKEGGLGSSRDEQRYAYERGVSTNLELTLERIPGVLESRVHLSLPSTDPIFGTRLPSSTSGASVLLITEPNTEINQVEIAKLISGASGIAEAQVSVLVTVSEKPVDVPVMVKAPIFDWQDFIPTLGVFALGVALVLLGFFKRGARV